MKIELNYNEAQFVANFLFEFAENLEKMGRDEELKKAREIYKKMYEKLLSKDDIIIKKELNNVQ